MPDSRYRLKRKWRQIFKVIGSCILIFAYGSCHVALADRSNSSVAKHITLQHAPNGLHSQFTYYLRIKTNWYNRDHSSYVLDSNDLPEKIETELQGEDPNVKRIVKDYSSHDGRVLGDWREPVVGGCPNTDECDVVYLSVMIANNNRALAHIEWHNGRKRKDADREESTLHAARDVWMCGNVASDEEAKIDSCKDDIVRNLSIYLKNHTHRSGGSL